jgi:hypothetical protein
VPRPPDRRFLVLVGLVITGALVVRLIMLGRQSYWIDEVFSANQSGGSLRHLWRLGSTEVHTPLYAGLLWAWSRIGGSGEAWTRLLSTLFAIVAVAVTHRGLRAVPLSGHVRWALTVATAAGGTTIVYSLETRSYALLLLGSAGLTTSTLRAALLTLDGAPVPRRTYLAWTGWSLLAATTHLFGAVLTAGAVTVLVVLTMVRSPRPRGRRVLVWALLAAAGCVPQAAWIVIGRGRPGFAEGTDWIQAPDRQDVVDLVTSTFSAGGLTQHKDGFAWVSPIGVICAVVLCLGATAYGYRARSQPTAPMSKDAAQTAEFPAAVILLTLSALVVAVMFVVSQWIHLWTLRNLVIVAPALLWGVICLAVAAARTEAGRRGVATAVVGLLGVSLIPITIGLAHPYKTDFRGVFDYLMAVRAEQPDARFVFLGQDQPAKWEIASDVPATDPAWDTLYGNAIMRRRAGSYPGKPSTEGPGPAGTEVVIYYRGVASPHLDENAADLIARLGPDTCRRIPLYGLVVVRCH